MPPMSMAFGSETLGRSPTSDIVNKRLTKASNSVPPITDAIRGFNSSLHGILMESGHTRLLTKSDRAIGAPSFSSSEENTLKIDEQIVETEWHFSPGREVNMIGDEINRTLTRVSEFSDNRLFASNAELSASRTS